MAIKIIELGDNFNARVFKEKCEFCCSVIEFAGSDARNYQTFLQKCKVIACPVCGMDIAADLHPRPEPSGDVWGDAFTESFKAGMSEDQAIKAADEAIAGK